MECLICCDPQTVGCLIFLDCLHSMCRTCLLKLQKPVCPFCRTVISDNIIRFNRVDNSMNKMIVEKEQSIRIQFRRRSRSRLTTDIFDTEYGDVIIEEPFKTKRKPKAGKNNFRKGRWANGASHTRNYW